MLIGPLELLFHFLLINYWRCESDGFPFPYPIHSWESPYSRRWTHPLLKFSQSFDDFFYPRFKILGNNKRYPTFTQKNKIKTTHVINYYLKISQILIFFNKNISLSTFNKISQFYFIIIRNIFALFENKILLRLHYPI